MKKREKPKTVQCAVCGDRFSSAIPDDLDRGKQGIDCASMQVERNGAEYILCGYGSRKYDNDLYRFTGPRPDAYRSADPICDQCVTVLIETGAVVKEPGEFPFGFE